VSFVVLLGGPRPPAFAQKNTCECGTLAPPPAWTCHHHQWARSTRIRFQECCPSGRSRRNETGCGAATARFLRHVEQHVASPSMVAFFRGHAGGRCCDTCLRCHSPTLRAQYSPLFGTPNAWVCTNCHLDSNPPRAATVTSQNAGYLFMTVIRMFRAQFRCPYKTIGWRRGFHVLYRLS